MTAAAAAAAAAGVFPNSVLLEPYVFRRDDDKSFPDETEAPIRASGTTSWGAKFRIAFCLADPPSISRLYAQLPGFPGPDKGNPLEMVATHRHLALLRVNTWVPSFVLDDFIFKADEKNPSSSSLIALPRCTVSRYDSHRGDGRRNRTPSNATPRLLDRRSLGLWCGDKGEGFVVAELSLYVPTQGINRTKAFADICKLHASFNDDQLAHHKWDTARIQILCTTADDLWKFSRWQTDAAIPFQKWLCWIDYHQGILFWDVAAGTISFLWFPPDRYLASTGIPCSGNGGVSITDHGRSLKFVYVARHDSGPFYGPLKPGTGFNITCHTLVVAGGSMAWKEDYTVTSDDLPDHFRGGLPMFPRVDIDRPQVVHFLFIEFVKGYTKMSKMSVLSIDMNEKTEVSFYLYMDGKEPPKNEDPYFFISKCFSPTPRPFLFCEFPRFCYLSRKRKDME